MIWKILICSLALMDFKAANTLFDAGKFAEAAAAYEKIEPKSAHVFFNLGNAYYRTGELGRAALNYERARQLSSNDPDILANLRFAEERLNVADANVSPQPVVRLVRSVAESRTVTQWSRYEVVGIWLTIGLVAAAIWWPRWRGGLVILAAGAGLFWVGTTGLLVYRRMQRPAAVVLATKVEARFAPLADATVHFQLGEGAKVFICEDRGQWWWVERADRQRGWVRADGLERVGKP